MPEFSPRACRSRQRGMIRTVSCLERDVYKELYSVCYKLRASAMYAKEIGVYIYIYTHIDRLMNFHIVGLSFVIIPRWFHTERPIILLVISFLTRPTQVVWCRSNFLVKGWVCSSYNEQSNFGGVLKVSVPLLRSVFAPPSETIPNNQFQVLSSPLMHLAHFKLRLAPVARWEASTCAAHRPESPQAAPESISAIYRPP